MKKKKRNDRGDSRLIEAIDAMQGKEGKKETKREADTRRSAQSSVNGGGARACSRVREAFLLARPVTR